VIEERATGALSRLRALLASPREPFNAFTF
jgi:hypothetical protein